MGNLQLIFGYFVSGVLIAVLAKWRWHMAMTHFLLVLLGLVLTSILFISIILGCFRKIVIEEIVLPAFKFLYFETQGDFYASAEALSTKFAGLEYAITANSPTTKFLGLYFDEPSRIRDKSKMRVCWGFALFGGDKDPVRVELIAKMTARGGKSCGFPECRVVQGRMPFVIVISFILAIKKIYPVLLAYLKQRNTEEFYRDAGVPIFHMSTPEEIAIGYPVGVGAERFAISSLPQPERQEDWTHEKQGFSAKSK